MRSSDWQPISTAPLNAYGGAFGPTILVWSTAAEAPIAAYFCPMGGAVDNGPRWVDCDGLEIAVADVTHWMPIAAPWGSESKP